LYPRRMPTLAVSVAIVIAAIPLATAVRIPTLAVEDVDIGLGSSCVDDRGAIRPRGTFDVVPATPAPVERAGEETGVIVTYTVEVEAGLPVDAACFAEVVGYTLAHPLGWTAEGAVEFRRVDEGIPDIRITLADPATVDLHCLPLRTGGIFSCWNGTRTMINYDRWTEGADDFGDDLTAYRIYVINHEVGHGLGRGHVGCPRAGDPAPVMMQQTKTAGACVVNGWPAMSDMG
jgi:hypothetical protein